MKPSIDLRIARFDAAFDSLPERMRHARIDAALILGSGWSMALPEVEPLETCAYAGIPGLDGGKVVGHAYQLRLFEAHNRTFLAFQGRRHWYEDMAWDPVILPLEMARRLGARLLLATNAAGGIRPDLVPGRLMRLQDHLNLSGLSPFQGASRPAWSPAFPDLSSVYDAELGQALQHEAEARGLALSQGIYAFSPGPCYETPAEIRALTAMGADAVGMSTVPECMLGHVAGMRVVSVSCITNLAAGLLETPLTHAAILDQSRAAAPAMTQLIASFLALAAEA